MFLEKKNDECVNTFITCLKSIICGLRDTMETAAKMRGQFKQMLWITVSPVAVFAEKMI